MSEKPLNDNIYVAPVEAPASRRPPVSETGVIGWLRENLFKNVTDTIVTLITLGLVLLFLNAFLGWALFSAQWEIAFLNLQTLMVGQQFPREEAWRIEIIAMIVIGLSALSVGVWGRINRGVVVVAIAILITMVAVPALTRGVPEPPVYTYITENYDIRQVNFIAQEGQEVTFTLDPLTSPLDFELSRVNGYIENDNQQFNTAFDAYNTTSFQIDSGQRDPEQYDLNVAIQVWDNTGAVLAETEFSEGTTDPITLEWEAPYSGWFTYTATFNEQNPGRSGSAWLRADNLELFRSTTGATQDRIETYGEPPELDCATCATQANRTDMRFQGSRTLAQYFSLQLAPFLEETRGFFFTALVVAAVAFGVGKIATGFGIQETAQVKSFEQILLTFAGLWFIGWFGVQIASAANPSETMNTIRFFIISSFIITMFLYALIQFAKDDPQAASRAMTVLWVLSVPVVLTLLTGFATAGEGAPLPQVDTNVVGGLTLTLLLSAVAIIASFPIGMALALGRQSELPVVSLLCTIFIEVLRGVPLITLLFMGRLILPFFGFGLGDVDLMIRIIVVLTLFTSAYMAEVIRGGLQIVPKGQIEAAYAVGLNGFWTTILIKLPQALRAVIPAIMGQAVSLFKDTSLVYIVSLFEILGTMNQILGDSQTGYIAFPREGYLFVGIIYFIFSYMMADVSRRIEKTGSGAVRRETL